MKLDQQYRLNKRTSCSDNLAGKHSTHAGMLALALLLSACQGPFQPSKPSPNYKNHTSQALPKAVFGAHGTRACTNAQVIKTWSLQRRSAQLVIVPVQENAVTSVSGAVKAGIGGVILFGSTAPNNLGLQLAFLKRSSLGGITPFVMADEEGGAVQRMENLVGYIPWPRTMAATMSPAAVNALATNIGRRLISNGVTMDLAPDLDLASGPGPDAVHVDGPRSFSPNPAIATTYGLQFANGLANSGVVAVAKHFPGEGSASANTDVTSAVTPPWSALQKSDLLPFEAAIKSGIPAIMVGNASVPGLSTKPASLSRALVTGVLRKQLGFKGLILTDSLSAGAIANLGLGVPQAAVEAINAGADMVMFNAIHPNALAETTVKQLTSAVQGGQLSASRLDAAVLHVLTAKQISLCPSQ